MKKITSTKKINYSSSEGIFISDNVFLSLVDSVDTRDEMPKTTQYINTIFSFVEGIQNKPDTPWEEFKRARDYNDNRRKR